MATIKSVTSQAPLSTITNYVTKSEKTEEKLLSGKDCNPELAGKQMMNTKKFYGKLGGTQYYHFVQSFHAAEKIKPEEAHRLAMDFVSKCPIFDGFEVLVATHKDRKHVHTHFVVNSVSYSTGKKLQMNKRDLQAMKNLSDNLCRVAGLSVCVKGKTFEGQDRENVVAYKKETYRHLKKAEEGKADSWVRDIGVAVIKCQTEATSRKQFIDLMQAAGITVDWQDNHKYIVFEVSRNGKLYRVRNSRLERYYNVEISKEALENVFALNAAGRIAETAGERAAEESRTAINQSTVARRNTEAENKSAEQRVYVARNERRNREDVQQRSRTVQNRSARQSISIQAPRNSRSKSRSRGNTGYER